MPNLYYFHQKYKRFELVWWNQLSANWWILQFCSLQFSQRYFSGFLGKNIYNFALIVIVRTWSWKLELFRLDSKGFKIWAPPGFFQRLQITVFILGLMMSKRLAVIRNCTAKRKSVGEKSNFHATSKYKYQASKESLKQYDTKYISKPV